MYSPLVIEKRLHKLKLSGKKFKRRSITDSISITKAIQSTAFDEQTQTQTRQLSADEQAFIISEQILCINDFNYWACRYGSVEVDGSQRHLDGNVAPAKWWPSQERALKLISQRDEENARNMERHKFAEGIKVIWHKTRQQGATMIARLISQHRLTLHKNTRAIAASMDDTKVHELYSRDSLILDNLPFWLKPKIDSFSKDDHTDFAHKSRITYQKASQHAGIGTGQQFDMAHMTEIALWPNVNCDPYRLKFDFLPAVPQSPNTFVGWESTANGRNDFWHDFTESVRKKEYGFGDWIYVFTPWYINHNKNRRVPTDGWEPLPITKEMYELVERTSPEFAGDPIRLSPAQMFWWETEYSQHQKDHTLHLFFSNHPTTPEQSFQHSERSALPVEVLDWMRTNAASMSAPGLPYVPEIVNRP